jgi:hypothetical protein
MDCVGPFRGTDMGYWSGCSCCTGEKGYIGFGSCACFPSAMNNQLRTGADKGNPTV